jgi:hypothetical protein
VWRRGGAGEVESLAGHCRGFLLSPVIMAGRLSFFAAAEPGWLGYVRYKHRSSGIEGKCQ